MTHGQVFLVDDDLAVRASVVDLLSSCGYAVRAWHDGDAFLADLLADLPASGPAVLLTDMRMPGMSGVELHAELKRRERMLPVIYLSGESTLHQGIQAMKLGAFDFILKPFGRDQLLGAVAAAIELDRHQVQAAEREARTRAALARLSPRQREVHALLLRGASAGRRIEVVDVIEVPSLAPSRRPVDASMALHFFTALLAAALAALCVGAGSVLFGPWGATAAALGWVLLVWLRTARLHRQRRDAAALWGAHLVLPLLAAALWQAQVALGWWPPERPLDLFADPPAAAAASAAPGIRLDWRLLWLCLLPLLAAFYWLVRLRQAALLAVVTLLLWGVAFQAVAGVLQSLGLAFHGMSTFALLLGGLTLAAALYIDLRVRRERAPDFARWPYLGGALLLGIGWVSLAVLPSWVLLPRYAAWLVFVVWALSLQRVGVVAIALALAGFELAWGLARVSGSGVAGIVAWVLCLAAVGGISAFLLPRRQAWSEALHWWMPVRWRAWYAAGPGAARAHAPAHRLSDTAA
jgi:FixJ family two-component response regulator